MLSVVHEEKVMPVYTYRCESCGIQFDRQQSFSEAPLRVCPECRKKSLKKVISPVGIVFKGSGFYSTDHRPSTGTGSPTSSAQKDEKKEAPKESKATKDSKAVDKG
jgi:putative FmdB family regulatory protein